MNAKFNENRDFVKAFANRVLFQGVNPLAIPADIIYHGDEDFGYTGYENLTTSTYSNGSLACMDLKNGKIDAVIIDKQPAIMITKSINGDK